MGHVIPEALSKIPIRVFSVTLKMFFMKFFKRFFNHIILIKIKVLRDESAEAVARRCSSN